MRCRERASLDDVKTVINRTGATMQSIVVIGASAGGVETLRQVVSTLPAHLPCAVLITLHIGANKSELPGLLSRAGALPASHPSHGERIQPGKIYIAPPDHHMLVEQGRIALTRGPRENRARPAIDPLFRSAAIAHGAGAIGVILTGGLNDGTAGLFEIKAMGGRTVVQTPEDAINAEMPQSALDHVQVDHVRPASEIGRLLGDLVGDETYGAAASVVSQQEIDVSTEYTSERPVALTCPDCGGALQQRQSGPLTRFVCHIGHGYTLEVMLAAQFVAMEQFLEQALRSLNERTELCRLMSLRREPTQSLWTSAKEEAMTQAKILRRLLEREWLRPLDTLPRRSVSLGEGTIHGDQP